MSIKKFAAFILFAFLLGGNQASGENLFSTGSMTYLSVTKRLTPRFEATFYHYDITSFQDEESAGRRYYSGVNQLYQQTTLTYIFLPNVNFAIGHIYSRNEPFSSERFQNENRVFQQVTVSHHTDEIRFSHRLRFEERFIDERDEASLDFRSRLRYQFGAKATISPPTEKLGEFYSNSYTEFYFPTSGAQNAFLNDNWTYTGVGYQTEKYGSFEIGPLLQTSVVNKDHDTRTFLVVQAGWNYKF